MRKPFLQFTAREVLLGISIAFILIVFGIIGYSFFLYHQVQENKDSGFSQAETYVIKNSSLKQAESVARFHGKEMYFAVEGTTAGGDKAIAFVPETKENDPDVEVFLLSDLIPPEQVINSWEETCENCSLIDSSWALENGVPLLEIKYISNSNRYVFEYYNLENGKTYARLPLKRTLY